ncbi:uncharacterized protein EV420DRAFT_1645993 [Desarmillaria tabescens]|uniref:Uncharacterized protein n=1 Tax=Armillaria tabescens TaxID=1929756 RepID=A0AA39MZX0_ARMTA|nr:uncharacterized protein EV420DRAFT_1645993 [Desarmillaria tabescens]KAK0452030.1 hypothetical protein EV420DRAFT_1645993 [Desarmillaria tabescens]
MSIGVLSFSSKPPTSINSFQVGELIECIVHMTSNVRAQAGCSVNDPDPFECTAASTSDTSPLIRIARRTISPIPPLLVEARTSWSTGLGSCTVIGRSRPLRARDLPDPTILVDAHSSTSLGRHMPSTSFPPIFGIDTWVITGSLSPTQIRPHRALFMRPPPPSRGCAEHSCHALCAVELPFNWRCWWETRWEGVVGVAGGTRAYGEGMAVDADRERKECRGVCGGRDVEGAIISLEGGREWCVGRDMQDGRTQGGARGGVEGSKGRRMWEGSKTVEQVDGDSGLE